MKQLHFSAQLTSTIYGIALLIASGIGATLSQAAVYKQMDEHGNVTYSDVATKKDEKPIAPPKVMTFKPLATPQQIEQKRANNNANKEKTNATRYASIQIAQPGNDSTIRANGGILPIQLDSNPQLNTGDEHRYVVLINGKIYQSSTTPGFELTNMVRGTHTLTAQIHDSDGNILANSSPITVHVLRASILHPKAK